MNNDIKQILELGYHVIPLATKRKIPLIQRWGKNSSCDPKVVESWEQLYPQCNWGVVTGKKSGIVVIDVDPRHGGDTQWKRLTMRKKFETAVCKTGGGGEHYYFSLPDGLTVTNTSLRSYPGIDIRGDGGQAVIPPSIHESGQKYEWIKAPWEVAPIPIPAWLLKIINVTEFGQVPGEEFVGGQRNNSIYHQALMLARQGALVEFTLSAVKLWRDQSDAKDVADSEIEATVTSAYKKVEQERVSKTRSIIEKTDSDNADRLVALYSNKIRYAPGMGWLSWNDKAWIPDDDESTILTYATESMVMMRDEALEDAKNPENFKSAIIRAKWAENSLNIGKLHAAVELAKTREKIRVEVDQLDPRESRIYLNMNNGMVNLKTGELVPHDPKLFITKVIPLDYDPHAVCPFWEHTLELAFDGNKELISYMKRALGYSITGSVSEQCLFICWGEQGNNGKSTILEAIQNLLGPYAQMSDVKVITSAEADNRVASSLAKLPGVRLVSMNEAEENQRFSEALIKQITGGDTLQACKKFKEPFEFSPLFKLWIRTNEKPIIRGMSDAIWRRIKLIPFEKPIPSQFRKSRDEVDDKLRMEYSGIVSWLVSGSLEWYKNGLLDPDIVCASTSGYRLEMDIIQSFFDECVIESTSGHVSRADLYQTFARWAKENGVRYIMSADAFSKRVKRKLNNQEISKVRGQRVWLGVTLSEFAQSSFIV